MSQGQRLQPPQSTGYLTAQDFSRSRTSYDIDDLRDALRPLMGSAPDRLLDIGCGFGGLSVFVGRCLGAKEICGVDIDDRVVEEARSKGVDIQLADAGSAPLPYPDGHFPFVMTLGMMDYLVSFDGMIREVNRVLAPGGTVLVSLPNLASWNNRLALLLGYQPRDVEISTEVLAGVMGKYTGEPAGHIHIPTVRAFEQLMGHHGFATVRVTGGGPRMNRTNAAVRLADQLFTRRPSLARRFYYLGVKQRETPAPERSVDNPYQSL